MSCPKTTMISYTWVMFGHTPLPPSDYKECEAMAGERLTAVVRRMVEQAPCWCEFNGIKLFCDASDTVADLWKKYQDLSIVQGSRRANGPAPLGLEKRPAVRLGGTERGH
jgi:phage gp37-like protein